MWGRFMFLLLLLVACSVGPGFFLARKLPWSPPEKLCAALGLSLLALYLSSFVIYALHLPQSAYFGVSALCLALLALSFRDLTGLLGHRRVRRQIAAFGFLFLWALGLLSLVRHYSGGAWLVGLATPIEASLVLVFALLLHHMVRQAMAGSGVPRSAAKAAAGRSHRGATAADARRPRRSARENPRRRP